MGMAWNAGENAKWGIPLKFRLSVSPPPLCVEKIVRREIREKERKSQRNSEVSGQPIRTIHLPLMGQPDTNRIYTE